LIVDLDAPSGLDPIRVGGKAAALAAARASGVAVLPGFVVEASASREHMELGARTLPERGSGGARLAVGARPVEFADRLITTGAALAERLVARSSTLLEASGEWSGAFTSYVDVTPGELPKAVVGCWASAFAVAALERQEAAGVEPGSFPMAVLVQPALDPEAGGWAELGSDGTVTVSAVKGSPAPLLQGWVSGNDGRFDDRWSGAGLIELVGEHNLNTIKYELTTAAAAVGANRCEWALTDRIWALQVGRVPAPVSPPSYSLPDDLDDELLRLVRLVVAAPGRLGDELVWPWAIAGLPGPVTDASLAPDAVDVVRRLERELTEEVWNQPWAQAGSSARGLLARLRGGDFGSAVGELRRLKPPDPERSARLLAILRGLRGEMADRGVVPDEAAAWHLGLDEIEAVRRGAAISLPTRLGVGSWEPFVAHVALAAVTPRWGTPASPGIGAGRGAQITGPGQPATGRRRVLTAGSPTPNLASLLWDAAGLVTASGSPAAHLFEAARALRVPAVCGVALGDASDLIVAVDGGTGAVATLPIDLEV
jgi:hypothetical protein